MNSLIDHNIVTEVRVLVHFPLCKILSAGFTPSSIQDCYWSGPWQTRKSHKHFPSAAAQRKQGFECHYKTAGFLMVCHMAGIRAEKAVILSGIHFAFGCVICLASLHSQAEYVFFTTTIGFNHIDCSFI